MWGGVVDNKGSEIMPNTNLAGVVAFVSWRGAYLSKQVSIQNMILIPMRRTARDLSLDARRAWPAIEEAPLRYWFKSWIFGRDISRF